MEAQPQPVAFFQMELVELVGRVVAEAVGPVGKEPQTVLVELVVAAKSG